MRTTVDIEDSVLAAARALAQDKGISIGAALSELARRGLSTAPSARRGSFPVFEVDPDAPALTLELVNEVRDDST